MDITEALARADSWDANPGIRPEPALARMVVAALATQIRILQAIGTKLSVGELAYMRSALEEAGGVITAGTRIQYDHTEGRAVSGLAKKGMVMLRDGETEVTPLGAAWFLAQSS